MITIEEKNEAIAAMMGYIYKTEVTTYEYYMDYRSDYEKNTIYSNLPPKLKEYQSTFGTQILAKYDDYFDSDDQEEGFKYKSGLYYNTSLESMFEVIDFIEDLGFHVIIEGNTCSIESNDGEYSESSNYMINCTYDVSITKDTKKEAIFEALYEFSQYIKKYNGKD